MNSIKSFHVIYRNVDSCLWKYNMYLVILNSMLWKPRGIIALLDEAWYTCLLFLYMHFDVFIAIYNFLELTLFFSHQSSTSCSQTLLWLLHNHYMWSWWLDLFISRYTSHSSAHWKYDQLRFFSIANVCLVS